MIALDPASVKLRGPRDALALAAMRTCDTRGVGLAVLDTATLVELTGLTPSAARRAIDSLLEAGAVTLVTRGRYGIRMFDVGRTSV